MYIYECSQYVTPNNTPGDHDFNDLHRYVSTNVPGDTRFDIPEVSYNFVLNFLKSLDSRKATGLGDISARLLKGSADVISTSITIIINLSIRSRIFPSSCMHGNAQELHPSLRVGRS